MKSLGLWLTSVTLLGLTLGCGGSEPAAPPAGDTTEPEVVVEEEAVETTTEAPEGEGTNP